MRPDSPLSGWLTRQTFRLHVFKEILLYPLSPQTRPSRKRLANLKNSHTGQRCFIIGNGPSIRKMDLRLLKNEFTFGLNRIYLLFDELGFATTYLVAVNRLVIEQCVHELISQPCQKFLPWSLRRYLPSHPPEGLSLIQADALRPGFCHDARRPMWQGATVTYVAMQLAYHMGFDQVILIGVDHSFATTGKANKVVVSQGDDPNHFAPEYFGKGFRWQLPDLETSEIAYRMARRAYDANGRQILDATINGKLTIFPKVDYASLF